MARFSLVSFYTHGEGKACGGGKISYRPSLAMTDKVRGLVQTSRVYLSFITISRTSWHIVGIQYIFFKLLLEIMVVDSKMLSSVADMLGKYAAYFVNVFSLRPKHLVNTCLLTPVGLIYIQYQMNTCQGSATSSTCTF